MASRDVFEVSGLVAHEFEQCWRPCSGAAGEWYLLFWLGNGVLVVGLSGCLAVWLACKYLDLLPNCFLLEDGQPDGNKTEGFFQIRIAIRAWIGFVVPREDRMGFLIGENGGGIEFMYSILLKSPVSVVVCWGCMLR